MKPGDFFVGVQDFFAVLLPGFLAMWLLSHYVPHDYSQLILEAKVEPTLVQWVVAALGSYVLGNFVFMAGSRLDPLYDRWRTRNKPTDSDRTFAAADALRQTLTPPLAGGEFTVLKWTKSYIQIHCPGALVEIERFEATSKFFRSMVVVSVALFVHFFLQGSIEAAVLMLILGLLSYERFRDQRWKATELSYGRAVIVHETQPAKPTTKDVSEDT